MAMTEIEKQAHVLIRAARERAGASQEDVWSGICAHPYGYKIAGSTYQKWEQGSSRPTGMLNLVWIDVVNNLCEEAGVEPSPFGVSFPLTVVSEGSPTREETDNLTRHRSDIPSYPVAA